VHPDTLVDLVVGALMYRFLVFGESPTRKEIARVVDEALARG
jgi:hypothetical protein